MVTSADKKSELKKNKILSLIKNIGIKDILLRLKSKKLKYSLKNMLFQKYIKKYKVV